MTARTDAHRPSAPEFDPEAYECYGAFDTNPEMPWGIEEVKARREVIATLVAEGYRSGAGSSGQCGHCGARIRYAALLARPDIKEFIFVGETCLDNRFAGLTKAEFARLRKNGELNRDRMKKAAKVAAVYAANPGLEEAFRTDHRTVEDIKWRLDKYGEISEKQVALVFKIAADEVARATRRAEQEAQAETLRAAGVCVPTGRVTVEGTILTVRAQDGFYGEEIKMLVQTDEGWKVWGTMPSAFWGQGVDKGARVRFTAAVEPSQDDALFGFYKRPTKAEVIARAEVTA